MRKIKLDPNTILTYAMGGAIFGAFWGLTGSITGAVLGAIFGIYDCFVHL